MLAEDGLYIRGMHLTWRERTDIWPNHRSVAAVNSKQRSFLRSRIYRSAMVFFVFKSSEEEITVYWHHPSGAVAVVLCMGLPC